LEKGKLIGQGRTSQIFEWGKDRILKLYRTGMPSGMIEHEFKISLNIHAQLDSTPKAYEIIEIDNRKCIIYERIDGLTMMKKVASKPWIVKKEAQRFAELHKSIQQKVKFELPKYKTRLKDNISNTDLLSKDTKERLYQYIEDLEDGNVLCHGDFHPDNLLIIENKPIIIDWMTATIGNPLADIARTSVIFKFGVVPEKTYLEKKIIESFRNKFYSEYLKHYIDLSGTSIEQIHQWELPVAAARLIEWPPEDEREALLGFISMKMEAIK
jgi:thiamine kinase-like enzyme